MKSKKNVFDVLTLGAGPAGLTAALYSARFGMYTGVISKNIGGMANLAQRIENYPGYEGSGFDLMQRFHAQAKKVKAEFVNDESGAVRKCKNLFVVKTQTGKVFYAKTLILALGTEKKKLNLKDEEKYIGKGLSYCAVCDGPLFKSKKVAVIGGSDSACKTAEMLSGIADKVYLVYRGRELSAEEPCIKAIKKNQNLEILYNSLPDKIIGEKKVEKLVLNTDGRKKELEISGLFVEIGAEPVSVLAKELGIELNEEKFIKVNHDMETSAKGVFAAGDLVQSRLKQVVLAAAQGAIAAKSAYDYLQGK